MREQDIAPWALMLLIILMVIYGFVVDARSHEAPSGWSYPTWCCSGKDCNRIPADRVKEGPDGYRVTLLPGDHDFITKPTSFLVPYKVAKPSPDGEAHICITQDLKLLCFFVGSHGS